MRRYLSRDCGQKQRAAYEAVTVIQVRDGGGFDRSRTGKSPILSIGLADGANRM